MAKMEKSSYLFTFENFLRVMRQIKKIMRRVGCLIKNSTRFDLVITWHNFALW